MPHHDTTGHDATAFDATADDATAFDATGPVEVDIDLAVGYAEVIASDRDDVTAEVTPTVQGRAGDVSLAAAATITFEDGRLQVRLPRRLNLFGQKDSSDVLVSVPTGSRVTVTNAPGSVRRGGASVTCASPPSTAPSASTTPPTW